MSFQYQIFFFDLDQVNNLKIILSTDVWQNEVDHGKVVEPFS